MTSNDLLLFCHEKYSGIPIKVFGQDLFLSTTCRIKRRPFHVRKSLDKGAVDTWNSPNIAGYDTSNCLYYANPDALGGPRIPITVYATVQMQSNALQAGMGAAAGGAATPTAPTTPTTPTTPTNPATPVAPVTPVTPTNPPTTSTEPPIACTAPQQEGVTAQSAGKLRPYISQETLLKAVPTPFLTAELQTAMAAKGVDGLLDMMYKSGQMVAPQAALTGGIPGIIVPVPSNPTTPPIGINPITDTPYPSPPAISFPPIKPPSWILPIVGIINACIVNTVTPPKDPCDDLESQKKVVQKVASSLGRCKQTHTKPELEARISAWTNALSARKDVNACYDKYRGGADDGHKQQVIQIEKLISDCNEFLKATP